MKRVLLLNPPADKIVLRDKYCSSSSKADYFWPPIDLLAQSGILHNKYNLRVLDAVAQRLSFEKAFDIACGFSPDVVIFLTGSATWKDDMDFMQRVKDKTSARIIAIGGNLLTTGTEIMRMHHCIDAILLDFTSSQIISFIEGESITDLKDMVVRSGDDIVSSGLPFKTDHMDTFEYPVPRHELFPLKKYVF
ncbi:MAG: hypothetical protein WC301_03805, partial [Candidatus Omnitrophota bacterium]